MVLSSMAFYLYVFIIFQTCQWWTQGARAPPHHLKYFLKIYVTIWFKNNTLITLNRVIIQLQLFLILHLHTKIIHFNFSYGAQGRSNRKMVLI